MLLMAAMVPLLPPQTFDLSYIDCEKTLHHFVP
jgi:hypothetical protein